MRGITFSRSGGAEGKDTHEGGGKVGGRVASLETSTFGDLLASKVGDSVRPSQALKFRCTRLGKLRGRRSAEKKFFALLCGAWWRSRRS